MDYLLQILNWLFGLVEWIIDLVVVMFKALGLFLLDLIYIAYDKILGFIVVLLAGFDLPVPNFQTSFSALGQATIDMLVLSGFTDGLSMILATALFKYLLRFIPFLRL